MTRTRSLAFALAFALAGPLAAQRPVPTTTPLAAPAPVLPGWSARLSFHLAGGVMRHALDPRERSTPALLLGASFIPESWIRLEAEMVTAALAGVRQCPGAGWDCPPAEGGRLLTLFYGVGVSTPTYPLAGFLVLRSGWEVEGRYRVFELGAGGTWAVSHRLALRLDVRERWDYPFLIGGPVAGTAVMLGLSVSGGGR